MKIQINHAGQLYEAHDPKMSSGDIDWLYENIDSVNRLKFETSDGVLVLGSDAIQQCSFLFLPSKSEMNKAPVTRPATSELTTDTSPEHNKQA